jgi:Lon protease-like protein
MSITHTADTLVGLALFPLQSVLFPQGLLSLKVFETRYLDLMSQCLREGTPFGVVRLTQGQEVHRAGDAVTFEALGCMAEVISCDSTQPGILQVRCRGTRRFRATQLKRGTDGLWSAQAELIDADAPVLPPPEFLGATKALAQAIKALALQGTQPFLEPYQLDQAGWVANRWCELLPIPQAARQKLMELEDPLVRLKLVDEFLRSRGVIET